MIAVIGKPYLWKTLRYGDVAVHVAGISPNGMVAMVTIDGGEASKQAQHFPELSDGVGHAVIEMLHKRPAAPRKPRAVAVRKLAEDAGLVKAVPSRTRRRASEEVI